MSFHSWLQDLRPAFAPSGGQRHHRPRGSLRAATHRPSLEVLEDRCLLAFLAPVDYGLSDSAPAIVTADFNGDGKLDLATVNPLGIPDLNGDLNLKVGTLFGNGDGTFQPPRYYDIGQFYLGIGAGDFDGDGKTRPT